MSGSVDGPDTPSQTVDNVADIGERDFPRLAAGSASKRSYDGAIILLRFPYNEERCGHLGRAVKGDKSVTVELGRYTVKPHCDMQQSSRYALRDNAR